MKRNIKMIIILIYGIYGSLINTSLHYICMNQRQAELLYNYLTDHVGDELKTSDFLDFCKNERFLPDNSSDSYWLLSILTSIEVLVKIKNGYYLIEREKLVKLKSGWA